MSKRTEIDDEIMAGRWRGEKGSMASPLRDLPESALPTGEPDTTPCHYGVGSLGIDAACGFRFGEWVNPDPNLVTCQVCLAAMEAAS